MSRYVEPTVTVDGDTTVTSHPAYGVIKVVRTSGGGGALFGSEFDHQHRISIEISPSAMYRSLNYDRHYSPVRSLLRLDMSESQWATFVSSIGVGEGTPCTLTRVNNEQVPGIAPPKAAKDKFDVEANEAVKEASAKLQEAIEAIDGLKLSGAVKDALRSKLKAAAGAFDGTLPWIAKMFAEHTENTVEKAKIEINAYANSRVNEIGLRAIAAGQVADATPPILLIGESKS